MCTLLPVIIPVYVKDGDYLPLFEVMGTFFLCAKSLYNIFQV
jgi:hypothetical protein